MLVAVVFCAAPAAVRAADTADSLAVQQQMLPQNWRLDTVYTLPQEQLESVSTNFGGKVTDVKNYLVNAGRVKLQINIMRCASEADADGILARMQFLRKSESGCRRRGRDVVEFVCEQPQVIKKALQVLGLSDNSPRTRHVVLLVAPLQRIDYATWNDVYQALRNYQSTGGKRGGDKVLQVTKNIESGNSVTLRTAALPWGTPRYTFGKLPFGERLQGEFTVFSLERLPRVLGIPQVRITAAIPLKPFAAYQPPLAVDYKRLTAATPYWPTEHAALSLAAKTVNSRAGSESQKVEAILNWVQTHMSFRDDTPGARVGVDKALQQHSGRCWDFSDVFVTLCRSAGLPCRQVSGWLQEGGGHIWAEVYLKQEGWISVDPTATWLGVSEDYLPLFVSEDGTLPVVYWEAPAIEPLVI